MVSIAGDAKLSSKGGYYYIGLGLPCFPTGIFQFVGSFILWDSPSISLSIPSPHSNLGAYYHYSRGFFLSLFPFSSRALSRKAPFIPIPGRTPILPFPVSIFPPHPRLRLNLHPNEARSQGPVESPESLFKGQWSFPSMAEKRAYFGISMSCMINLS